MERAGYPFCASKSAVNSIAGGFGNIPETIPALWNPGFEPIHHFLPAALYA